uniref:Bridge-like lipid transfer protein family member 1 middle region domain-containing protein n=1 Tax=Romanomermis culicivorax TaxID=13658 RepID=A0A915K620_ROMCU
MTNAFQKVPSGVSCQLSADGNGNLKDCWRNCLQITLGKILIDIPLDPGFLHDVVLRGQKDFNERFMLLAGPQVTEEVVQIKKKTTSLQPISNDQIRGRKMVDRPENSKLKCSSLAVINFKIETDSIDIKAALLPSLRASYSIASIKSSGLTGGEAQFVIDVTKHGITFDLRDLTDATAINANVVSEISPQIDLHLPTLKARGTYVPFLPRVENTEGPKSTLQPSPKQQDKSGSMVKN